MLKNDNSTPQEKKEFKDKFCTTIKYANNIEENKSKTETSLSEIFSKKYLKTTIKVGFSNFILNFSYFGLLILFTPTLEEIYKRLKVENPSSNNELKLKQNSSSNSLEIIHIALISTLLRFFIVLLLSFLSQINSVGNLFIIRLMVLITSIASGLIILNPSNYSIYSIHAY